MGRERKEVEEEEKKTTRSRCELSSAWKVEQNINILRKKLRQEQSIVEHMSEAFFNFVFFFINI